MATGSGAGNGSKDVRAGGAFVEVYAKDELTRQLAQITAVGKAEMAKYNAAIKAQQAKSLGNLKAVKGGVGGALGLVGLAGGLAAMAKLTEAVFEAATGAQKFRDALEQSKDLAGRLSEALDKDREKFFASVGGRVSPKVDVLPEKDQRKAIEDRLARKEKELAGKTFQLDSLRQARVKLTEGETFGESAGVMAKKVLGDVPGIGKLFTEPDARAAEVLTDKIDEAKGAAGKLRKEVEDLHEQLKGLATGPTAGNLFRNNITDQIRQLREQADEVDRERDRLAAAAKLSGIDQSRFLAQMAGDAQALRFQLEALRKGIELPAGLLEEYKDAARNLQRSLDFKASRDQLRGVTDDLQTQLATWGKTAEEVQLFKLAATGLIPQGELDNLRGLIAMKKDLEQQDELAARMASLANSVGTIHSLGASNAGNLDRQIGLSDQTGKQNTEYLRLLAEGKGGLPKAVGQEIGKQFVAR